MRWKLAVLTLLAASVAADAGTIRISGAGPDGRDVSAQLDWSYDRSGDLCLWLSNLTDAGVTRSAAELLTGVSFDVGSIGSGTGLESAWARRTYDAQKTRGGVMAVGGQSGVNLLDVDPLRRGAQDEWRFRHETDGAFALTWNGGSGPDYGIIGAYNNDIEKLWTNGNGGLANGRSHHPYVYKTAFFKLSNPSFRRQDLSDVTFYFGTNRTPLEVVPLPPAGWMGVAMLAGLLALRRRRSLRD